MSRPLARRLTAIGVVGGCLAAVAGPALAGPTVSGSPDSSTVSLASTGAGTRQLELLDLAGANLTNLQLRPGAPSPFRVRVTDTGVGQLTDATSGFTVSATLNNLYAGGDPSAAFIPSKDVSVSFPAAGATSALGDITALPRTVLAGSISGCTTLLALSELTGLVATSGAGLELCNAVGSTGLTISALEVVTNAEKLLDDVSDVPFALTGQESGPFTLADYKNGIGATDTRGAGAAGTPLGLLKGTPSVADLSDELAAVKSQVQALAPVSADGTSAQTAVTQVIGEMLASTDAQVAALGNALSALTPAQAAAVVKTLTGTVQDIGLGDLLGVTGSYNATPVLTATPSTAPAAAGTYSGTMTVTLVQP